MLMGFDVDPGAIRKTAARKSDSVHPLNVDNREFQIAVERCSIYQLPFHGGWIVTHRANQRCDLNHQA